MKKQVSSLVALMLALTTSIAQSQIESPGGAPAELLRFEFKTKPIDASDVKPKAHEHSHE